MALGTVAILAIVAIVITLLSIKSGAPLWVAVLLVAIAELVLATPAHYLR